MNTRANLARFPRPICIDLRAHFALPSLTLMQSGIFNHLARAGPAPTLRLRLFFAMTLALCAIPCCAALQKQQKHEHPHHQIDQLEDNWRAAILASDTSAISSLLADDYTAITSEGTLQTREDWLASLRSGRVHFTVLNVSDRKIRFYGNTAVVTSRAEVEGANTEGPVNGSFRYTRVYVRNPQGKWKIVSFEASRIQNTRPRDDSAQ